MRTEQIITVVGIIAFILIGIGFCGIFLGLLFKSAVAIQLCFSASFFGGMTFMAIDFFDSI